MIRLFGFLTGVVVTGIALLLFTDELALESARAAVDQVADRLGARVPMNAESPSFAATPRPEELRAGPGWIDPEYAVGAVPVDAPDNQPSQVDPVVAGDPASPDSAGTMPVAGTAGQTAANPSAEDGATAAGGPASDVGLATDTEVPADPGSTMPTARAQHASTATATAEPTTESSETASQPAQMAAGVSETLAEQTTAEGGQWFAFWTPFRSRVSAQGFATHLGVSAGQEIRVLRMGPGEYRVAFFHSGEDERRDQLARLEQASGLKMGGEL